MLKLLQYKKTILTAIAVAIILLAIINALLPLKIVNTSPENQTYHNPNEPIIITFNHNVQPDKLQFSLQPETGFTVNQVKKRNTIILQPKTSWLAETDYQLTINFPKAYTLFFKTQVQAGNSKEWAEGFKESLEQEVAANKPQNDGLRNIRRAAPITQTGFTVEYDYANNTYTVKLAPPHATNKTKALEWFNQQGVTDFKYVRLKWQEL